MNLNKIRKQLEKIDRTVQFLSEEDELTQVEKDLLLDYVRALYGTIQEEEVSGSKAAAIDMTRPAKSAKPMKEVAPEPEPEIKEEVTEPEPEPVPVLSPELTAVFQPREATELSDKLSLSPISDLTNAMSINERIFTVNELFSGNQGQFNECLKTINDLTTYEEAVDYLSKNIVEPFGWEDPGRIKKVEQFMLLVQRRFA